MLLERLGKELLFLTEGWGRCCRQKDFSLANSLRPGI